MLTWLLLLALGLRLINLNQSLWLDEAFQFKSTYFFSLKDLLTVYLPRDFNPPLSYLINFFFNRLFGWSEISLRLPSVILAVLTVWLVYQLAGLLLNKKSALLAGLLMATAPLHLYYSQEARMYSLVTLTVTASTYFLLKWLKFKSPKQFRSYLISYTIFTLLTLYSHYLAWFILPAHLLIVFFFNRSRLKTILLSQLIAFIGFLPWLPLLLQQLQLGFSAASSGQPWSQVVGGLNLKNLLLIPVKFLIGRISIDNNLVFAAVLAVPLLLTAYLFYLALRSWKKPSLPHLILFSWLFVPLFFIILISLKVPVLAYFRLLFLLPAFYLILVLGLNQLRRPFKNIAIICLLIVNLLSSGIYLFNSRFHREDWQSLTQALVQLNPQSAPVLVIPVVDAPLRYYATANLVATDNLASILDQSQFWYVPYAEPIFDPGLTVRQQISAAGFQPDLVQHFRGDLTLIKYIK